MRHFFLTFSLLVVTSLTASAQNLSIDPVHEGGTITFDVTGGTPNADLTIAYSLAGPGPSTVGGLVLDLSSPIERLAPFVLDGAGDGTLGPFPVPPAAVAGFQVWFQGVEQVGTALATTNMVHVVIQPSTNNAPIADDDSATTDEDTAVLIDVLANDSDPDGDTFGIVSVSAPTNGSAIAVGGQIEYTPGSNFNGSDSFDYTITDSLGAQDTATVTVTVSPINDAPDASDYTFSLDEDTVSFIDLSSIASDKEGDALTYSIVSGPTNGTAFLIGDSIIYQPTPDFFGADMIVYEAFDGSLYDQGTIYINVLPIDDPPVAVDDSFVVDEDAVGYFDVMANDIDPDNGSIGIVGHGGAANGILNVVGTIVEYTPNANFFGADSFYYTISDETANFSTATVVVTVSPINDAPVAVDGSPAVTDEDTPLTIDLAGLASDVDGDALSFSAAATNGAVTVSGSSITYTPATDYHGSDVITFTANDGSLDSNVASIAMTVNSVDDPMVALDGTIETDEDTDGSLDLATLVSDVDGDPTSYSYSVGDTQVTMTGSEATYSPLLDFNGAASFTYTVTNGADVATATVYVTVNPINDAPVAIDGSPAVTDEDTPLTIDLAALASDVDGDALSFSAAATNGAVTVSGSSITYTPATDYHGSDVITFTANDGSLDSNVASIAITVNSVNDAPVANSDSMTTDEDLAGSIDLSLLSSDIEGDALTYTVTHPNVTVVGSVATYLPSLDFNGTDAFVFTVSDGDLAATATIDVTINSINDAPVASDDSLNTSEEMAVSIDLAGLVDDVDHDLAQLTFSATHGGNGSVAVLGTIATYTPELDFNGSDVITFTANDGSLDSNAGTISVTVNAVNDAPIAVDGSMATDEDTVATIDLSTLASDVDGDVLTYSASHPNVTVVGSIATYSPDADFNGTDAFAFTVSDGALTATANVAVTVNAVNDAPVVVDSTLATDEDNSATVDLSGLASDVDLDALSFSGSAVNGTVSMVGSILTYAPNLDYNGSDVITFTANDGSLDSNAGTISVTVNAVNDAPIAVDGSMATDEDTVATIDLSTLASDVDGDVLTYSASHPNVTVVGSIATYSPDADFNGADAFAFTVSDGALTATANVAVTVNAVNDAPVVVDSTLATDEDNSATVDLSGLASDVDLDALSFSGSAVNGTVSMVGSILTYAPNLDYNGSDVITFTANDGSLDSNAGTISVTVNAVNDAPIAVDGSMATDEDTLATIDLSTLASDVDLDALTYSASHPNVTVVGSIASYSPDADFNGADTFAFTVSDGALTATANVAVTVNAVNDAPVASSGAMSTDEDNSSSLDLTTLVTDVDNSSWTFAVSGSGPDHGSAALIGSVVVYIPEADFDGTDAFVYSVDDGDNVVTETVTVTVNAVNDAPVANADSMTTDEDMPGSITLTASDVEGDPLTYALSANATNGTVTVSGNVATYTPNPDFNGTDSFSFYANDGQVDSAVEIITVTVSPVNDAPVANDLALTTAEDTPGIVDLAATDVDGDTLTYTVTNGANGAVAVLGSVATYSPDLDFNGTDSFTYTVTDGIDSETRTVSVAINAVNDAPVANADSMTTDEDMPGSITLTASDVENDPLTYALSANATNGTVTVSGNVATYSPDLDFNGTDSFSFYANDGQVDSEVVIVTVTVDAVNDAPVANDLALTTDEDTAGTVDLTATDVDGDTLTYTVTNGANGAVAVLGSVATYSPDLDFNGTDSFTYTVTDGIDSETRTVSVAISAVNDAPVASAGSMTADEDIASSIDLSTLVTEADGDMLTYTATASNGTVSIAGSIATYTSNSNYNGPDVIVYTVSDGIDSATDNVAVTVNPIDDSPIANDDLATTNEDESVTIDVAANDIEPDGDAFGPVSASTPLNGTTSVVGGMIIYTPNPDFFGTDSFTYIVSDVTPNQDSATVTVTVLPVNDAPVANDLTMATDEDTPGTVVLTATDVDGDVLTYTATDGANGTVTVSGNVATYSPDLDFNGTDSFAYTVTDGIASVTATVTVTVNAVNDAPVASADSMTTDEDTAGSITLTASDVDEDALTYVATNGANGTVTIVGDVLTYTPGENFNGTDAFDFYANDGQVDSAVEIITVTVSPVNDAPVANDLALTTAEDTPGIVDLAATDVDGDALTYTATDGANGTVAVLGSVATYSPDLDFNGTDSFTYTVTDGIASVTRTVTVTVNAVNDAPVASADSMTTDEDTPGSIILTASDVDEDALTYVATNGANGSVTVVAGVATYTPDENFNGTDSFTFYANDSQVDSNIATVTVNVTPVNDAPVATTTLVTTDEDTSVSFDLTTMVSDPEGDTLTFTVSNGAHGSVLQVGSLVIYTPETNYEGSDSVPFTVTDGIETVAASVAIEVLPVDDSPYVDSDFNGHMVADEMLQVNWALHVTDPDAGDVLSVLAVTWPLPGNVATNNPGTTYVTYIPAMGFTGTDTFNIIITDTTFNVVILPVTITVVPAPSLDMITLAAGSFDMGDHALVGDADELPTHNVSLAEFNVDRNEVRAINYSDYLNTSVTAGTVNLVGSSVYQTGGNSELLFTLNSVVIHDGTEFVVDFADVDMPAVSITWHGAAHYANWVSEKLSLTPCYDETTWSCDFTASGLRLPTEAEFEYASRSGEQTPYFQFPWASDLIDFANANYFGNGVGAVVNVGSYLSNGYGLNDISGNAAEWCNDWYDSGYYSVSPLTNPEGPLTGTLKVTRGGSWNHIAGELRSAARDSGAASTSSDRQGFRLAQKN